MSILTTAVPTADVPEQVQESVLPGPNGAAPPLQSGDRLTRAEFERRYWAHPEIKRAELIEGVVYVSSPVHLPHATMHSLLGAWLGQFWAATPGVRVADNVSLRLDIDNEVQPDLCLRVASSQGALSRATAERFLEQAPELIVEVAASSAAYDLHQKRHVYRRNGVGEYLVLALYEQETYWFELVEGEYVQQQPAADGILRSNQFPGLWLDVAALWAADLPGLVATLQAGLAAPEHAEFVARLAATRPT